MTPEERESGVERLAPWFHRIDLGDGIVTKTASVAGEPADHPLGPWEIVRKCLPDDLTGLRVLDVGCNAGFYAVEAKRRNAAFVLGVDSQRHQIRQATFVRRALGLDIALRRLSVYDLSRKTVGEFDITLALGLVYHCKHLVLALERLFEITRGTLILETAVLLPDAPSTGPINYTVGTLTRQIHPLAYVENDPGSKESVFNWFLPSSSAMAALLRDVGFSEVSLVEERGDRATFSCRKAKGRSDIGSLESYAASLTLESGPVAVPPDSLMSFRIRAENTGLTSWRAAADAGTGIPAVSLGIHLLRGDEEVDWDFGRTSLREDVPPGHARILTAREYAPSEPGSYILEFDMIAEQLSWFEDFGTLVLRHSLEVEDMEWRVPWVRLEGLREGVETRGLHVSAQASCAELVDLAARTLAPFTEVEATAVQTAFRWVLGYRPDVMEEAALFRLSGGRSERFPIVIRRLLWRPESGEIPDPLPEETRAGLANRIQIDQNDVEPAGVASQSFAGEAAMARSVLRDGRALGDEEFVHFAYERVLGRGVDSEGASNAIGKLSAGDLNRPHLLRELFWSEELRGR